MNNVPISIIAFIALIIAFNMIGQRQAIDHQNFTERHTAERTVSKIEHEISMSDADVSYYEHEADTCRRNMQRGIDNRNRIVKEYMNGQMSEDYARSLSRIAHLGAMDWKDKAIDADAKVAVAKEASIAKKADLEAKLVAAKQDLQVVKSVDQSSMELIEGLWLTVFVTSIIVLFIVCPLFRWLVYVILAVATLGAVTKLFK
jgi:hypothetical protein